MGGAGGTLQNLAFSDETSRDADLALTNYVWSAKRSDRVGLGVPRGAGQGGRPWRACARLICASTLASPIRSWSGLRPDPLAHRAAVHVTTTTSRVRATWLRARFRAGSSLAKRWNMRQRLAILAAVATMASCDNRLPVQCEASSNCDLTSGGVCATSSTGHQWCAYSDPSCPSGLRYATQDVGDGVAGMCVAPGPDGGTDGSMGQPAQSCVALPYTCGTNNDDNCCNSLAVPAGTYFRSYDAANDASSGDKNSPATISAFRLDKYEVTVGRFRAFIASGAGTQAHPPAVGAGMHPNIPGSGWEASWNTSLAPDTASLMAALKGGTSSPACGTRQTWTDAPVGKENFPINCITWYEAMAFCIWDGGFLPTEAEWNYVAAGGDEQRAYPWSDPSSSLAIDVSHASYDCSGTGCDAITAVGTKPAGDGRWGHTDLAGNVFEWTLDWQATSYLIPCADCANLTTSAYRISRGGSYDDTISPHDVMRTGYRGLELWDPPDNRNQRSGVRCARAM